MYFYAGKSNIHENYSRESINKTSLTSSEYNNPSVCLPSCLSVWPQRLKHTESDRLQVQIQAYLDNVFDVGTLLEDAETKNAALERVEELEENLATVREIGLVQVVSF